MRLRAIAFALAAFGLVAAGALQAGRLAADLAERRATEVLEAALTEARHSWAEVRADGLIVRLGGEAPDETARFHAIEIARSVAGLGRIEDDIAVAGAAADAAPAFALELMRSEGEVSLIGLVPAEAGRETIAAGLAAAGIGATVTDMLETADHPAPPGWAAALAYGLAVIGELPRAKVSLTPGSVEVAAVAEDAAGREALARRLAAEAPEGVDVALDLSAPRPVIAPFALVFRRLADGEARLVACSAETEADAELILAAARDAGLDEAEGGAGACRLGLGAPSPDWAEVAASGIAAVAELGAGSFTLSDMEALLIGPLDGDPIALAAAGAALGRDLPAVFTLTTRGAARVEAEDGEAVAFAPEFHVTLAASGEVRLAGPLGDRSSQIAVQGFAEALFGHERVVSATILDPNLPEGWPGLVLAGVEALALLEEGSLAVTAEGLSISGRSLEEEAGREIESFFAAKGTGPVVIDVVFDAEAAAARAAALRSPAEICADRLRDILAEEMILFEVGSARIDDASGDVIAEIATALADCPGARFEVSGHTDGLGSAELNQRLSVRRAEAVVEAVAATRLADAVTLLPAGYGPDRPVADNDTEEGRASNRRIEFALLDHADDDAAGAGEAVPIVVPEVAEAAAGGDAEGAVDGAGDGPR